MDISDETLCVCGHPKYNHPRDADCVGACYRCDDGMGGQCDDFVPADSLQWPRPIPVSERLPELKKDGEGLFYSEEVQVCIGHRYNDGRFGDFDWHYATLASEPRYYKCDEKYWKVSDYRECEDRVEIADSTHWMPKPPMPPKPE